MNRKTTTIVTGMALAALALVFFPKLYVKIATTLGKSAEIQEKVQ